MRNDLIDVSSQLPTSHCDVVETGGYNIANVYKPSTEPWEDTNPLPSLPHTAVYVGDFNSHLPDWGYDTPNNDSDMLLEWASCSDLALVHDPKQRCKLWRWMLKEVSIHRRIWMGFSDLKHIVSYRFTM